MTDFEERRAKGAGRVSVETLVEVCGNEPGSPAFEARAVDVSPRGMHLRTAYLPEHGMPLVCRFEEGGREIVVEGRVAWERPGARGGEFGVEFTALDAGSVGALRDLCERASERAEPANEPAPDSVAAGARVRLHIDGLGSPMKARVREGGTSRVQVGSNLEFLKVGRHLEVEDLDQGGRRDAQIDSVSVTIDPQSRVPQLVVQLRFDGAPESTPQPSITDLGRSDAAAYGFKLDADAVTLGDRADKGAARAGKSDPMDTLDADETDALRGRVGVVMSNAGEAAKTASEALARFSTGAAQGVGSLFKGAGSRVLAFSKKRRESSAPKRTTAPAPGGPVAIGSRHLRPQGTSVSVEPEVTGGPGWQQKHKFALGAGGAILLAAIAAFAVRRPAPPPGADTASAAAHASDGPNVAPDSVAPATPPQPTSAGAPLPNAPGSAGPVAANVPLFGPTPLATMEPAALAPSPTPTGQGVEAAERAAAKAGNSSNAPGGASDEAFADGNDKSDDSSSHQKASSGKGSDSKGSESKGSDKDPKASAATRWGHGKMHEPTIYRLRLDGPGAKIDGSVDASGFSVTIPGRKVMEPRAPIAERDPRFSRVHTANAGGGAQISFKFKDSVPAYRVRLRGDYIEFLISDDETKASDPAAPKKRKSASNGKPLHTEKAERKRG